MTDKPKNKKKHKLQARRRFRRHDDGPPVGEGAALMALHAELVLLREENARLKAAEHELPGLGSLMRRVKALSCAGPSMGEEIGDEAAHMLAETLVLRESMLEASQEIRRSLEAVERRLRDPEPAI